MGEPVLLGSTDPAEVGAWLPVLREGGSVVLPDVPGAATAVREALSFGLLRLVADPTDADLVAAAQEDLARQDVVEADRTAVVDLLERRLAGETGLPDTEPHVLVVAVQPGNARLAHQAQTFVSEVGGRLTVWATTHVAAGGGLPVAADVVDIGTAPSRWLPDRLERLLVLRGPAVVLRLARRAARLAGRVLPGPAGRAATSLLPRLDALDRWRDAGAQRVHRPWSGLMVRIGPALLARRALSRVPVTSPHDLGVDVVVAPVEAQALVWRLLRSDPGLASRGSVNSAAVRAAVRHRVRTWASSQDVAAPR
ncbi:hypothetical protein [Aquipuribacter sp. MA13-6]|uniref:hypothetical protein n=1 Tax=unclassified Aquipuribacter TaxID=2635084 RepID=UPI003EEFC322